ncbi:MAG: efflux RND transporter periplasmic adaptor subunit [Bacteroidales bacterium]
MKAVFKILLLTSIVTVFLSGCNSKKANPEQSSAQKKITLVNVTQALKQEISSVIKITGTVTPNTVGIIKSPVNGVVETLYVRENYPVTQGQIVAVINPAERIALIAKNRQAVNQIQEKLKQLKDNDTLRQALSKAEYDLDLAYKMYLLIPVTAELDGIVSQRFIDKGSEVSARDKLLEIYQPSSLVVKCEVNEKYFSVIKKGKKLPVRLNAYPDKKFTGTISLIYPKIDPVTRSLKFDIKLDQTVSLVEGMMAEITLATEVRNDAVCVPDDALLTDINNNLFLYSVDADSIAHKINVVSGISSGGFTEIVSGINPGNIIVIKGQELLKDGQKVKISGPQKSPEK